MPDNLKIDILDGKHPGQRVVRLAGNLSLQTVPSFLKVVREENAPAIIVDFSNVSILDSAGVGALIQTHVACARTQRRLALAGLSQRIEAVLEVTRVRNLFPVYSSTAEAESQFG
jgi:anti-sigma B factor antagonist